MVIAIVYGYHGSNVGVVPHMLQPEEVEQRALLWQQQLKEYRQHRQAVMDKRQDDIQLRNIMKKQQIELAEQWQVAVLHHKVSRKSTVYRLKTFCFENSCGL